MALAVVSNWVYAESTTAAAAATTVEKVAEATNDGVRTGIRTPSGDVSKFWDKIDWNDMSDEDKNSGVLSDGASWNKLSKEKRAAATTLDFKRKSWDSVPAKSK